MAGPKLPAFLKVDPAVRAKAWADNPPKELPAFAPEAKPVDPAIAKIDADEAAAKKARTSNRIARMKEKQEVCKIPEKFRVWNTRRSRFVDRRQLDAIFEKKKAAVLAALNPEKETAMATKAKKTKSRKTTSAKKTSLKFPRGAKAYVGKNVAMYESVVAAHNKGDDLEKIAAKVGKSVSRVRAIIKEHA
jgi:hypothetical protein